MYLKTAKKEKKIVNIFHAPVKSAHYQGLPVFGFGKKIGVQPAFLGLARLFFSIKTGGITRVLRDESRRAAMLRGSDSRLSFQ
jgi:hypothetical protein